MLLLILVLIGCAALAGWWVVRRTATTKTAVNSVTWISPQIRDVASMVNATGTLKLKTGAEVRVGAQLSGIVRRLNVTVGSHVREGAVIAEIDSRAVQARVDQAAAQLAQAEVSLAKANADYARSQKLVAAGLIPAQQFDDSASALNAAKASVEASQSALATARVDLAYVEIRAPISGTIASISTQQGETVAASFTTPTFVTIIHESALEVVAMVDEADIGGVRPGQTANFTVETYPNREFQGTVTRIAPVATILSGVVNYEVAVSIARDIALLRPDMTANVNIRTSEHHALMIPSQSIHTQGGRSFVYVCSASGVPEERGVTVLTRNGSESEIGRGLSPSDKVAVQTE
ncbi:efflux RND transporter periplasmic adaptor subunit [Acidicapsa acidisoli]|uniref:efflux RND transporter periplasmic adaptor subunit n=1 Tax=Acidicapsa acidisoli TaxID=1615681 RepID=UPI0021E079C0|nr:efflux RND transporter periplasmic adaptor subunit [Acidicapsa acidisoli]